MNSLLVRIAGGAGSGARMVLCATALAVLALGTGPAEAFNETGGSGVLTTEQAYSLPIGRPLFSLNSGFYSNNFTPGTSRLLTMTPSATMGLGGGFEAAAALPFEGLSSSLDSGSFTRRVDFRRSGLLTKLRWTSDIGSPRLRGGVMGHLTLPLGAGDRPGATVDPTTDLDRGLMALLSTNLGWFDFPLRVHLNLGYWWSRDDGAFVYRSLPTAIPVGGAGVNRNDVMEYTLAFEAGLRRAAIFVELHTEQFVDARDALSARENLWQLTPGFRTQLNSSVGLTGGVTFDVSSDDARTAFDTVAAYPDYEIKLGLTLGNVLGRERHEESRRDRNRAAAAVVSAKASRPAPAQDTTPPAPAPVRLSKPTAPAAPAATADALRLRELEERLARVETAQKLAALEARLASLERHPAPPAAALQVQDQLDALQRELQLLKEAWMTPVAPATAAAPDSTAALAAPPAKAAVVADPASVTAPTVSPEVQAQLDNLQGSLQRLLDQQAARDQAAAAPPAVVTVPDRDRSTVIIGDGAAVAPPVLTVPAPVVLDPALQQPYQPEATATAVRKPAAPAPVAVEPAPAAAYPFGLEVGQRRTLVAIDATAIAPLAAAAATAELDALAVELADKPAVGIALLVHGGGADRAAALATSGELAALIRDYLVAAGVSSNHIVPIGMGHSEGGAPRVEIERIH